MIAFKNAKFCFCILETPRKYQLIDYFRSMCLHFSERSRIFRYWQFRLFCMRRSVNLTLLLLCASIVWICVLKISRNFLCIFNHNGSHFDNHLDMLKKNKKSHLNHVKWFFIVDYNDTPKITLPLKINGLEISICSH